MAIKRTHFAQMLEFGNRFLPEIQAIDGCKARIAEYQNPDDIRLLDILEHNLLNDLLDLCTREEIEEARDRFANLATPKPKGPPRKRVPRQRGVGVENFQPRKREAQVIAAKLDRALLAPRTFKPIDHGHTVPVRIDSKTTIYIKPTDDPAEARRKYLERNNRPLKDKILEK